MVGLTLVNPRFYHVDTALAVLDDDEIMYYPAAFSAGSRARLAELYPDAVLATDHDAEVFGLNAVSDGGNVVMAEQATGLAAQLRERGVRARRRGALRTPEVRRQRQVLHARTPGRGRRVMIIYDGRCYSPVSRSVDLRAPDQASCSRASSRRPGRRHGPPR